MAAAPLRAIARALGGVAAALVALVVLVLLTSWIGSSIPRNAAWTEPGAGEEGVVEIMVGTNGVHTELVLPLTTPVKDWRPIFPVTDIPASGRPYTHVAVSWGEREVFLNTPTWADLRVTTALGALLGGDALLHVAHYVRPAPGPDNRPLRLTAGQYARLVGAVEAATPPAARRAKHRGYADWDVFYDAPGRYDSRRTCNQWTSDTLAAAGVRTGWWTPLAGGVMKWLPPIGEESDTARPASADSPHRQSGRAAKFRRRMSPAAAENARA